MRDPNVEFLWSFIPPKPAHEAGFMCSPLSFSGRSYVFFSVPFFLSLKSSRSPHAFVQSFTIEPWLRPLEYVFLIGPAYPRLSPIRFHHPSPLDRFKSLSLLAPLTAFRRSSQTSLVSFFFIFVMHSNYVEDLMSPLSAPESSGFSRCAFPSFLRKALKSHALSLLNFFTPSYWLTWQVNL